MERNHRIGKAIFVVGSPFQALCAIEAIHYFEIDDYKVYIWEYEGDNRRFQCLNVFSSCNIKAEPIAANRFSIYKYMILNVFLHNSFDIAFLGDIDAAAYRWYSLPLLNRKAKIIYLDDGNSTIDILNDIKKSGRRIKKNLYEMLLCGYKSIKIEDSFFTLFYNVTNPPIRIFKNDFKYLMQRVQGYTLDYETGVFVGTASKGYMDVFNLSYEQYRVLLNEILIELKGRVKNLIYIPHGRDNDNSIKNFCDCNNIVYKKLDVCIEMFLLQNCNNIMHLIAGFSSTSLFSLKKLFPDTRVINYCIKENCIKKKSKITDSYYDVANAYAIIDIENVFREI